MQPGCLPASLRRMSDHFTVTALHLGRTNAAFSLWRSSREDLQCLQIYSKCICCILLTWAGMSSFISITDITGMIFSSKEPAELDTVTASVQEHWVLPLTVHKHHFNTRSTKITEKSWVSLAVFELLDWLTSEQRGKNDLDGKGP